MSAKFGPGSVEFGRGEAEVWLNSCLLRPKSPKLGRTRSNLGRTRAEFSRIPKHWTQLAKTRSTRAKFGRNRPTLAKPGPTLAEVGPNSGQRMASITPHLTTIVHIWPNLGELWRTSDQIRANKHKCCRVHPQSVSEIKPNSTNTSIVWSISGQIWSKPAKTQHNTSSEVNANLASSVAVGLVELRAWRGGPCYTPLQGSWASPMHVRDYGKVRSSKLDVCSYIKITNNNKHKYNDHTTNA